MIGNDTPEEIEFLNQGGPTLELIRSIDWSKTAIGSREDWPQSLRAALGICVNSNFPIAIYWGPQLVLLYNEAWSPIPGNKHPWAFGKPAVEVWPDIWDAIEPQFQKALKGTAGGSRDALLPMQRHGYVEECYFDFTFTPIYGESGKVEGVFNAVIETTYRVINERRASLLQKLSEAVSGAQSSKEVFRRAAAVLENSKQDVPFFLIYEIVHGIPLLQVSSQNIAQPSVRWPADEVLKKGSVKSIDNIRTLLPDLADNYWPEVPAEAVMVPLKESDGSISGFIVGGISARRKLDKDYRAFYESAAATIYGELNTLRSLMKERERAESLAQIDKAKTAFFSNISHEFRTPLTLMVSPLEQVLHNASNLTGEQRNNLETSLRNTLRLQKLVNTLLDFSRIEAGKMEANFQRVNIAQITKDLASAFRSTIESAGISYHVTIGDIKNEFSIDVDMWEKIVLNLISNAFKYTEQGKIEVRLSQAGDTLIFKVTDTGIGISKEHLDRIFERFYRISNQGGRSQEGTGIGLAMVRELVQLHHGNISVESRYGVGSTFSVSIPVSKNETTEVSGHLGKSANATLKNAFIEEASKWSVVTASAGKAPSASGAERSKVIVADDNGDMREYIVRLLERDFEVYAASNGEEAYDLAFRISPDIILSDIMMPRLDGFGLLNRLKSNLTTKNIPVIFLSARAGEESRIDGIAAGADDYLIKPFSARELLARVGNQIAINRARRRTENEFFRLFLQLPAHIHVFKGHDHVVEFFHPLGKKFIGRDISGLKIREALPEFEGQGYFELLDKVYQTGETVSVPATRVTLPNDAGETEDFYFSINYLPWRDSNGVIQGVLQFTFDVTAQTKTSLEIKESEERFRILANSIPQFVWIADAGGKIEFMSERWTDFSGMSTEEGKKLFSSLIHPEDVEQVRARWRESLQNKTAWTSEFRLRNTKTESYRWFNGHTVPLQNEQGDVIKWIGSASDIQPQKELNFQLEGLVAERTSELVRLNNMLVQKNEELSKAQNFLQTVLDSSVELVMAFDTKLNYTFVNKRLSSISTRKPTDLIGRNLLEVEPGFESTEGYQHLLRALKGEIIHLEARRPHIDNSLVFETFIIPLKHQGEITGVVTMQRDITSIVKLTEELKLSNEQLKRSNDDLQQFAHVTSHDLKEPVRKIKMYGSILLTDYADAMPEKARSYLAKIDKATGRISSMIDGVLQYSTVDITDRSLLDIDLGATIRLIVEDLEIPIRDYDAQINYDSLPVIKGYPTLIYQLFYNLINNSLKFRRSDIAPLISIHYSPPGEVDHGDVHGDFFRITVEDNGVGFEQAYAEKIFESFTRLHSKDRYEGTGLGLALCRKIVMRHSGIIQANGELNKGARFEIFFPAAMLK